MTVRLMFSLALATLAGCGDDSASMPADMSAPADLLRLTPCKSTCTAACIAGATCVSGDDFNATCLKSCNDQRDCPSGAQCVSLRGAKTAGRWCVDPTTPSHCGVGCAVGPAQGCQGDVAVHGGGFAAYCASQYEYCPHGCELADGGLGARCNP